MTINPHVSSAFYDDVGRHLLDLARRGDAPEIADRLRRYGRVIAAQQPSPLDEYVAGLLSLASLAVGELHAALNEARTAALLAEAADVCAALVPEDFDDPPSAA